MDTLLYLVALGAAVFFAAFGVTVAMGSNPRCYCGHKRDDHNTATNTCAYCMCHMYMRVDRKWDR